MPLATRGNLASRAAGVRHAGGRSGHPGGVNSAGMNHPKPCALLVTGILALGSSSDEPPTARAPVDAVVVFREHDHVPEMELYSAIASPVVSQITTGTISGASLCKTLCVADAKGVATAALSVWHGILGSLRTCRNSSRFNA